MQWAASKNRETCFGCSLIKKLRVEFLTFFKFVVVRSFTAVSNLLQPTGVWTEHPHTSHVLAVACTHFNVARDIGSSLVVRARHPCVICMLCVAWFSATLPFALHRLFHLPFHSPVLHLHLPCGLVRWEVPCALQLMRSKALWPRTILPHDKAHWRVLTIYRASDKSWVHFTTRWKINWAERLDSRQHQNGTRIGSHDQLPTR